MTNSKFLINVNDLTKSDKHYAGNAGLKDSVIFHNEEWIVKYPKETGQYKKVEIPFTTTPLSEYIGSHIYQILGFNTHQTKLGRSYNPKIDLNQLVVLCKDFTDKNKYKLLDYETIKNQYSDNLQKELINLSSKLSKPEDANFLSHHTNIEEILLQFENNLFLKQHQDLKTHFWKMMLVDFLISNNDRNRTNWGFLENNKTKEITLAPVYDNGACFKTKHSDEKLKRILATEQTFKSDVENCMSHFVLNNENTSFIKLFKKLKALNKDKDLNQAIVTLKPVIESKLPEIIDFIKNIPEKEQDLVIITPTQKQCFIKSFEYLYQNYVVKMYNEIIAKNHKKLL